MKTTTKLSFQKLLDETKRAQYTDKDVVNSIEPCDEQEIEFFTLGKYVTCNELEIESEKLGFTLASPYALALYAKNQPEFADENWIATQWKDKDGKWCFATFDRDYGRRRVDVRRYGNEWSDYWWFAGLRKSTLASDTQPSALGHFALCPSCGEKLTLAKLKK